MLPKLIKMFLLSFGIVYLYKNRYRAMNWILSNQSVRKYAVQFAMNLPFLRKAFMQSAFR